MQQDRNESKIIKHDEKMDNSDNQLSQKMHSNRNARLIPDLVLFEDNMSKLSKFSRNKITNNTEV